MKVFVCLLALVAVVNSDAPSVGAGYGGPVYGGPGGPGGLGGLGGHGGPGLPGGPGGPGGPSIKDVIKLVENIELEVRELYEDLSAGRTLSDVAQEKINYLNDVFWPRMELINDQQDARAATYAAQIKAMQDRVDAAEAQEREALTWAQKTAQNTAEQYEYMFAPIGTDNDAQDGQISRLNNDLASSRQKYLEALSNSINGLNSDLGETRENVLRYVDFVDDRKCEYGSGSFNPRHDHFVRFKTPFLYAPEVSIFNTGFRTYLDLYSKEKHDGLAFDKYDTSVNATGFTVKAVDDSVGMVLVETVWCSWVACQGLLDDFAYSYKADSHKGSRDSYKS